MTIKYVSLTGQLDVAATVFLEIDIPDDATEEQIQELAEQAALTADWEVQEVGEFDGHDITDIYVHIIEDEE